MTAAAIPAMLRSFAWPICCGILAGLLALLHFSGDRPGSGSPETSPPVRASFADAVRLAAPAVANIYTSKTVRTEHNPLYDDPFFRHFFRRGDADQRERIQRSLGSAVIISRDGYLLTNHHVIRGADEILVLLYDGREALASVVGMDPETDLAVLKIDMPDLEPIMVGTPDQARVGDLVLAIGNPFGFGQTVTQGIISATGRYGLRLTTYEDFIQTDAAINPGNSGGALIDVEGRLLGINTAIYTRSGGSMGIGLAVPADVAVRTMKDLIEYGRPVRGWLGIEVQRVPRPVALANDLQGNNGVVVTSLFQGGPAATAGLHAGDIILTINDQPVGDGHAGMNLIAITRPGETVRLQVLRNRERIELTAQVGTRPTMRQSDRGQLEG